MKKDAKENRLPVVLVTNDDGIDVHGLTILVDALADHADVYVVAPADQQSGKSHSITFLRDVTPQQREVKGAVEAWVLDGTPADCVMWAIEEKLPLRMWGSGWDVILQGHMDLIEAPMIENSLIPDLYRESRVALNDHWGDMIENQFINNRIFDVLACGLPVISDTFDELRELFPTAVLHFTTREEFSACVKKLEEDYDSVKAEVDAQWPLIRSEYSFERRAAQLTEMVREYGAPGQAPV